VPRRDNGVKVMTFPTRGRELPAGVTISASATLRTVNQVIQVAINAIALWVAVQLIPGLTFHGEWWKLVLVAVAFGLVNSYIRPILRIVTLPITVLTLGIFLLVINALMLLLVGAVSDQLHLGFAVRDFGSAFLGAIVVALVGFVLAMTLAPARFAGRMF
jgi:putative membrane protein